VAGFRQVKIPRTEDGSVEFVPSRGRAILQDGVIFFAISLLAYVGFFAIYASQGKAANIAMYVTPRAIGLFLLVSLPSFLYRYIFNINHLVIKIDQGVIEGPFTRWFYKRVSFPIADLDCERSKQMRWWYRVYGGQYLVSKDGKKILVMVGHFNPDDLTRLMDQVGCQFAQKDLFYWGLNK
jgi:hypothetical protein